VAVSWQVTFDAVDAKALARFWARALHYAAEPPPDGFDSWPSALEAMGVPEDEWDDGASLIDPSGVGPRIVILGVPEPKTAKNRMHLDLRAERVEEDTSVERKDSILAEAARLEALGATRILEQGLPGHHFHVVMQDPEGNEFCVN
jgi:hypothetical protein